MPSGWKLKCRNCSLKYPSMIAAYFFFDRHGTLNIVGVCRFCLVEVVETHDTDEIAADIREAHNQWADEYGQEQIDLHIWEEELLDREEDSDE